ncbi:T9SS type A sorting domain-containing protein [Flavobacterium sp. ZS1P70]|uniref:T9SS type A sorting domain-containing protein n=1 Tax=Flavobacterium zhoui TaxID=3230414 RepID=A0ABW6I4L7_9FLAO
MKKNTILEFFDFLSGKITNCFLSKNTLSKLDLTQSDERSSIDFLSTLGLRSSSHWLTLPFIVFVMLLTGYTANAQNIQGVVPVQYPLTGSGVDGDAFAHTPDFTNSLYIGTGDLFDNLDPTIAGHGLINPLTGEVFYKPSLTGPQSIPVTYQLKDPYQNDPTIFTSSNKINDNPGTYTWGAGSSPPKNEIQNCGVHFSYGRAGKIGGRSTDGINFVTPGGVAGSSTDLWCLFAGDRQTINGSSYIDFEFLQAPLTITGAVYGPPDPFSNVAPITGGSGGFVTGAPASTGGRTPGDILVTIEFTQGGGDATVVIRKWSLVGGVYQYVVIPNTSFPDQIFITNNDSYTPVPFDVFGVNPGIYAPNQFAEGAINLTQVFLASQNQNPCFVLSTVFIRTRSSGSSSQSELKDFPSAPIQLNLDLTPNANAGADKVLTCTTTSLALSGSSTTAGATFSWVASDGGHIVSGANTATPIVDMAGTYTLSVSIPSNPLCIGTDVALVTLNNTAPNAAAGPDKVLTCAITSIALSGSSTTAGATFSWIASNGGFIVSGATSATPTVNAAGTYTLTVTDPANGCTATDIALVTLNNTAPNANAGTDKVLTCTVTSIALSGSSTTAGATFSWIASNGGFIVSGGTTATPTVNAAGTYTLTVTNPANGCTATDIALVTLNNTAPNAAAGPDKVLTCAITSIALTGSSTTAGATFSWIASNGGFIVSGATSATPTVNAAGTYTLTVTNPANGCTAADIALVTLNNTLPNVNAGADKELTCTITSIALSGSSTTAGATYSWVASNGGFIVSGATSATPTVNAAGTYTLTVTDPANGCTATDIALVTLNNIAPNANAGTDKVLTCTVTSIALSGSSTTTGATYSWAASNGGNILSGGTTATPTVNAAGTYTLTVTNPANGCTATDIALVTLDSSLPNVNAGADKVLTCTVTSIALSGSSTTAGATYSWAASNGGNIVSGGTTATPTVNAAGTYTLTVTNPANGCTATDIALVTLNNTAPNANAGPDKVLTCTVTSIALSGSSTTAGATYSWVASNGGNIVSGGTTATPTVNAAGTYTLTVTNQANGCTATDIALVTLNNTLPNVNAGADKELTCTITSIALSGSSTTAGATFSWAASNGGNIVSGGTTATPTVNAAGTYTLIVTNPANGCTATDIALVTLNNTLPNVNAGADKELTCTITSIALSGSSTTAGATFSWAASNGGNIVSGGTTATPTVNAAGTYTLTVTNPANGCTATDIALVTLNNTAPNVNAGADAQILCGTTTVILSGSSTTAGATFSWVASNGGNIVSGATTATPTVDAAGTYTLTVTNPANGCTATDFSLVTVQICVKALCTYTQGYYGNLGGTSCAGGIQYSTLGLIERALGYYNGTMIIGSGGNTVIITNTPSDRQAIIDVLPGGGGSYVLSASYSISSLPSSYLSKQGRINNTLLAQTITLGLNIGINGALGNFALQAGTFAIAMPAGGCGSDIPKVRSCNLDGTVNNEYKYYTIPSNIVTALGANATVQGLYNLANQALGGGSTNGLTLSQIASAVDLINNAFDECRIFVGYNIQPLVCGTTFAPTTTSKMEPVGFDAYPVPFKDVLTIKYNFDYVSDVKIEVFNSIGTTVLSKSDTNSYLNKEVALNLKMNRGQEQVYVVKVTTNRGSSVKKVMSSK